MPSCEYQVPSLLGVRKVLEFTLVGLALGIALGWLLSLVSGNYFVIIGVGALGIIVGIILGVIP